jgi:hypothetical protein
MATSDTYEFVEAILIKAATESIPGLRNAGADVYHEAMRGMADHGERSADNQVWVGGCRRADGGIYFSVAPVLFSGTGDAVTAAADPFLSWHRLPAAHCMVIERLLANTDAVMKTVIAHRGVLQEFI